MTRFEPATNSYWNIFFCPKIFLLGASSLAEILSRINMFVMVSVCKLIGVFYLHSDWSDPGYTSACYFYGLTRTWESQTKSPFWKKHLFMQQLCAYWYKIDDVTIFIEHLLYIYIYVHSQWRTQCSNWSDT